ERLPSAHIVLRGRDKDVIIRGGINIYPPEIEATLMQHDGIDEAAVVGIDDAAHGQIVVAFIAGNATLDPGQLDAWCRERMAPYKIPERFRRLESLPRGPSGKIDKAALATGSQ